MRKSPSLSAGGFTPATPFSSVEPGFAPATVNFGAPGPSAARVGGVGRAGGGASPARKPVERAKAAMPRKQARGLGRIMGNFRFWILDFRLGGTRKSREVGAQACC